MNDAAQPQHFTLRTGSSTSGSPASSRASSQSGFRVQAQSNNTPRPFSWGLNPVALPQSQSSRASSSSGRRSLPPPSFDRLIKPSLGRPGLHGIQPCADDAPAAAPGGRRAGAQRQHALEAEAKPVQARQPLRGVAGRQAPPGRAAGAAADGGARVSQSRKLLYSVPAALCEEIARAATEELAERLSIPD